MAEEEKTEKLGNSQIVEHSTFTWNIDNFSTLNNDDDLQSDAFEAGGHKWRIHCNKGKENSGFVIYIEPLDLEKLPNGNGWTINAKLTLSVINEVKGQTIVQEDKHTFKDSDEYKWGFSFEMPFSNAYYTVNDTLIVRAEIWCNEEQEKAEPELVEKADSNPEKSLSFLAELDTLFTDIQTLLEAENSFKFTNKQIASAQAILKQCLSMDLENFLRSGKAFELKNSLSIILATNSFPGLNMVDKTTKFLAGFDERMSKYKAAQRDLSEAKQNGHLVVELKATLKQLFSKFMPLRQEAEYVHREVERLESALEEKKAKKARLDKKLEDLAGQASASKQALLCAEQNMKKSSIKKEQAEKIISDFQKSWSYLKE